MGPGEEGKTHQAIRRIYAAFGRRDLEAIAAELHPDAELDFTKTLGTEGGVYPGMEGIERLLKSYWDAFEEVEIEVERFLDGSEGIVALVVSRGLGRSSGVTVEARGPHLWAARDGKMIRFTLYQEEDEARRAAGVPA